MNTFAIATLATTAVALVIVIISMATDYWIDGEGTFFVSIHFINKKHLCILFAVLDMMGIIQY